MEAPDFTALPPVPVLIDIGGERIDLSPLKLGELPGFARASAPVAAHLSASPDWLALFSNEGEALIDALALAARRPRDWVAALAIDEALHLAEAVFTVNADFFIRRLLPDVMQAAVRIGRRLEAPAGATPCNG